MLMSDILLKGVKCLGGTYIIYYICQAFNSLKYSFQTCFLLIIVCMPIIGLNISVMI